MFSLNNKILPKKLKKTSLMIFGSYEYILVVVCIGLFVMQVQRTVEPNRALINYCIKRVFHFSQLLWRRAWSQMIMYFVSHQQDPGEFISQMSPDNRDICVKCHINGYSFLMTDLILLLLLWLLNEGFTTVSLLYRSSQGIRPWSLMV